MLNITLKKEQKIFITSDTHYNHTNICRGTTQWRTPENEIPVPDTRDFKTLTEMNDTIVNGINDNVGADDILIHLGDWSFGGFQSIKEFRERINCKNIHLIYGNHDHHIRNNRDNCQSLFTTTASEELLVLKVNNKEYKFILYHFPISSWDGLRKGVIHLHGHVHLSNEHKFGLGKKMDAGVDGSINYTPYDIVNTIIPIMDKRKIVSENIFHFVENISKIK
jgi:calcineurin-like phosphoesterase family protein